MRRLDYVQLRKDIQRSPETSSVYIGCDSKLVNGSTLFGLVVIIHIESSKGGKCYAQKFHERRRLALRERLLKEVDMAVGAAFEVCDAVGPRNFELHLDINPKREHKSNTVMSQATGYVAAQGFDFQVKPNAFAASTAADYLIN